MSKFGTFGRSTSHFGMCFQDLGIPTLFSNNYNGLNALKTLKTLDLFGFKMTFPMKFKFIYF
jgi:hypothetical protein